MKTPICDFVREYQKNNPLRLHVPGHKGKEIIGAEPFDITEIDGADVLYHADGIIGESEKNAAKIFGSKRTLYSTEGSSLAIRAMVYLACLDAREKGRMPKVLAARNAHKTFISAAALLNVEVEWILSLSDSIISCDIDMRECEEILKKGEVTALYVTSPDYLGNLADIEGLSKLCKKYGVLLLVDNAHGAYLKFMPRSLHPLDLGADLCCDSAHKTLSVLTGGAYLHIAKNTPDLLAENAPQALSLFASTSPSYLILQSLDKENEGLSNGFSEKLCALADKLLSLKDRLSKLGYELVGNEPLKLTIYAKGYGYTGTELAKLLKNENIICEFYDPDFTVMMLSEQISGEDAERLFKALSGIQRRDRITSRPPKLSAPIMKMSPHDALMSTGKLVSVDEAEGKILASLAVTCPPAIPIAVLGEEISASAVECFKYYGMTSCRVVDENK